MVDFRALLPRRPSPGAQVDWSKEQKKDRVVWLAVLGSVPFIALAIVHQTLTTILLLQAYLLTSIEFGLIFFVEERDNVRRLWFWKAMAPCILVHVAVLAAVFFWDKSNPQMVAKGLTLSVVLWVAAMIDLYLMLWVIEIFRPSDENGKVGPRQDLY
jgi:hypothetical protein